MEVGDIVIVVIGALGGMIVGFIGGKVDGLKESIKASPNKVDDAVLSLAERIAGRIAQAKSEDPTKPLGQ